MFKKGSGLEELLLYLYAIFGLLEQLFIVAEAPDQHEGSPPRGGRPKRPLWKEYNISSDLGLFSMQASVVGV